MGNGNYHFELGSFKCIIVSDGTFAYPNPAQVFFANAPEEELEQALREHNLDPEQWNEYISPYTGLLIDTGRQRVLVDTGAGGMAPTTGNLIPNLQAEGITPEEIDTVILTHGHPDHIGGTIDDEGKPAFPNARYVMWKEEWEFWTSEPDLSQLAAAEHIIELLLTFARNNLPPIKDQIDLVDAETEVVPGIRLIAAPGHTPGHVAVAVSSGGEELLYMSDTALHFLHMEQPNWYSVVDIAPEQALASRRRIMEKAVAGKALVHASHFPFPCLGNVAQKGEGWQWQPIKIARE
jgi:glyoxylase-like metal-dependent hydrolase (beta-lactamase superfamily II)